MTRGPRSRSWPILWCAAVLATGVACQPSTRPEARPTGGSGSPVATVSTAATQPRTVVPQRQWWLAAITIDSPDGLAAMDGAVFVKTDDGQVARIDPRTNGIVRRARLDTARDRAHYCQGIGSDGRTLWACSASDSTTDLVRLDPATLRVTRRARVGKVFDQYSVPVTGGRAWVLTDDGHVLTGVDTETGEPTEISLPHRCFQLAATASVVYATCLLDDEVVAVDPVAAEVVDHVEVRGPVNVAVDRDHVWVSGSDGLLRLDADLVPQARYPGLVAGAEGDLVTAGGAVWVRNPDTFLTRIDSASGAVTARYASRAALSGGSVLVAYGSLWTSASDDSTVLRVALPRP